MNDWAEFRHFKYLLAIAEHKGFRAAAEYLHTAQPNLSAQAKQFQDLSDVHLFRKGKDGRIRLTATGIAFKPIAQGLLDARDEAIAALIAIERGEIRALKFGCASFCRSSSRFMKPAGFTKNWFLVVQYGQRMVTLFSSLKNSFPVRSMWRL